MKRFLSFVIAVSLLVQPAAFAKEHPPLYPGFPALRESNAYKKFATRTFSEFSKILYLIDRYSDSKILINYEDQNYNAPFSTTVARWFLSRNYKKQTAKQWVLQWCSKSIFANKPIYVKLPNEKFRLAREVLLEELEDLEQAVKDNQKPVPAASPALLSISAAPSPAVVSNPVPSSQTSIVAPSVKTAQPQVKV